MTKRITIAQAWSGDADCLNCSVRKSALFSGLTEDDFESIHQPVEQVTMPPGAVLYKAGDTGKYLYTLRHGLIKLVRYLPDGSQRIVRLMCDADVLGLELLVTPQYEHEALILKTTKLCRYPVSDILRLSHTNPVLHKDLMARWHKAVTDADTWLTELSTGSAKKRMAGLLLQIMDKDSRECFLLSREDIGSILSITVETASRTISDFKRTGLMKEITYNHYILDIEGLKAVISG
ncbi:MAG: Crp/Fnr family transcriptional regulator [Proteobacteria bacterium]|nr:Crp/Fnr family transcriptional regulator [Pseudomonadota bacterium]